jgi:phosphoglycerol transferase MdoB-like AlkP superfamily enzyme
MTTQEIEVSTSGGIGLTGLMFVAFLVLKLTGVIGWSWWWVTAPLWGPLALFLSFAGLILGCIGAVCGVSWIVGKFRR